MNAALYNHLMRVTVLILTLAAASLSACRSTPDVLETGAAMIQVEVLGFGDCPNTPEFLRRVQMAATRVDGARVVYVDQEALPEHDVRRGYPTPTALANGRDLFGLPVPTTPSMGCRMYEGGLPNEDAITARLRIATAR
ncbi:MAG: hypothetical protein IT438_00920 [Phycisphaerales bacterium]|nr:hypothetical protein [Phycisphaerales bacterium]HMN39748.1 hypothetical protein [Phycisphaerales bacterium]